VIASHFKARTCHRRHGCDPQREDSDVFCHQSLLPLCLFTAAARWSTAFPCAAEPRWNVWWKITRAGVALSPLKIQNSGVGKRSGKRTRQGAFAKKTSSSYILSKQPLHNSPVLSTSRTEGECVCAHRNKASGASRWYVILRKPGGTFDLCAFREINPRVLSLLWEEQTCCNAVKHATRMKSKLYFRILDANS